MNWSISLLVCGLFLVRTDGQTPEEYLDEYNHRAAVMFYRSTLASWAYYTNITKYNQEKMIKVDLEVSQFHKDEAAAASRVDLTGVTDSSILRQFGKIQDIGISGYDDTDTLRKIHDLNANMTSIYSTAKWCRTPDDCKSLEPGLTDIFTTSRNYEELTKAWKGWRDVSGKLMKSQYEEFVRLLNIAIKAGGKYEDIGAYYRSKYETDSFETDVTNLFDQFAPLYNQLHAYVRRKLRQTYGEKNFPASGHIPAHLFGNMWSQQWGNIYDLLEPYPGMRRTSLTEAMKLKNYNVTYMYQVAEEFFESLGMQPVPDSFWTNSMLVKPDDRDVVCHASAWDFYNGTDVRIKQCTEVTEDQLNVVHHEMGHIQYYLEYKNQPTLYRNGANPGFHEGVADIASLSFLTPEHLYEIGLLQNLPSGTERDINFLFKMALEKVAFLPFGYLIDQWRWGVFRGQTTPDRYNFDWWKLRCKFQGISPPVLRTEDDFDPGAKFHVAQNVPYIRYFVSIVAQFQWHKALCHISGNTRALHRCDIYRNLAAGTRLKKMLRMGSSRPWTEAMMTLTRGTPAQSDKLDAGPLIEYFKPLQDWLEEENTRTGESVGWSDTCPNSQVPPTPSSDGSLNGRSPLFVFPLSMFFLISLVL